MRAWTKGNDRFRAEFFSIEGRDPQQSNAERTNRRSPAKTKFISTAVREKPQGRSRLPVRLFAMTLQYLAIVACTVVGTLLALRWVLISQHPLLLSFLRPLTHCRVPVATDPPFLYTSSSTSIQHTSTFNYAMKQCGAQILPAFTGVSGTGYSSLAADTRGDGAGELPLGVERDGLGPDKDPGLSRGTNPDYAIDGEMSSSRCWEFEGSSGQLGFALVSLLNVTSASVSCHDEEDSRSAPRFMILWGLVDGHHSITSSVAQERLLGRLRDYIPEGFSEPFPSQNTFIPLAILEYSPHLSADKQFFPVLKEVETLDFPIGVVVLQVLSNWGAAYTRLCQVGIHGTSVFET